jgi:L-malate glycosyltransferase
MRVLQLTLSLEPGGRREAIRTLVARHRLLGVDSFAGCLDRLGCEAKLVQQEFSGHVDLARRRIADFPAIRRLTRFCHEQKIDVIHAHDAASQLYAALARLRLPHLKILMTFHRSLGFESARARDRLRNAMTGLACHAIVVGSVERREHYLAENHVPRSKVIRIPFGIDTERFFPDIDARVQLRKEMGWSDSTLVMGAVGHFRSEKGIDVVVRGFQQLVHQMPRLDCRLVVVGDGTASDRQRIESLRQEVSDPGRIHLVGFRRDIPRWFNAMDVFVHAPRQEAFGLVVAEAMATGLPVVATRTGGVPDMVRDMQTGLLVPVEQPMALAEGLARLTADSACRRRLAAEARRVACAEYRDELYAERYLALYHHLVGGRRVQCFDPFAITRGEPAAARPPVETSSKLPPTTDHAGGRTESCLHK